MLSSATSSQQQVLSAATVIAKHTSSLCNACRVASSKTTNPVAKRHFVQSAKDVANSTAKLVKEIKALDQDYSQANRDSCAAATQPLIEAVDNLCSFANSPDFASVPAKISPVAQEAQEPITSAGNFAFTFSYFPCLNLLFYHIFICLNENFFIFLLNYKTIFVGSKFY